MLSAILEVKTISESTANASRDFSAFRRRSPGSGELRAEPSLVSIVVVLFRDRQECIRLLQNISSFDPREIELIVIDGGSDDGTVEVLQKWDDKIDYWLSEPDSGIYDAMEQGNCRGPRRIYSASECRRHLEVHPQ